MRELAMKKLQAANEKAQDDIQIIDGTDEKDGSTGAAAPGAENDNVVSEIPVPVQSSLTVDETSTVARTPPLPTHMTAVSPSLPQTNSPDSKTPVQNNSTAQPPLPLPQNETTGTLVPIPVPAPVPVSAHSAALPAPSPIAVLPNLSVPPPPLPIPVPAPNSSSSAISKFNTPNNLVQIKSADPPKPPIVAFKTKSLSRLPLPPGINQNDLESIDSPPSRSPTPPPKVKLSHTPTAKPLARKSIKDLPMPPGW